MPSLHAQIPIIRAPARIFDIKKYTADEFRPNSEYMLLIMQLLFHLYFYEF